MHDSVGILIGWFWCATKLLGLATLLFGVFSVWVPQRSIALYQWIMAQLNWRVSPIDERREIRNTKCLGTLLVLLSLAMWWRLLSVHH